MEYGTALSMIPKLAFILPSFAGGGAERVTITLANNMDRKLIKPVLIVLDARGPLQPAVKSDIEILSLDRPRLRQGIRALREIIRKIEPTFVFSTMGYLNLGVLMSLGRMSRRPLIVIREANAPAKTFDALPLPIFGKWLYKKYYQRADLILCPSQQIKTDLLTLLPHLNKRIRLLHNPVDIDQIRASGKLLTRQSGSGLRFVACGRLTEQKGFDRLLDWFAPLSSETHLHILGDGPDRQSLLEKVDKLGLSRRVTMTGYLNNPWPLYAGADAFLLPSRWEGMPNAALEALACGTPVIASRDAGGIGEIAKLCAPSAIKITDNDMAFTTAMTATDLSFHGGIRPSLLPKSFFLNNVVKDLQDMLKSTKINDKNVVPRS
jgi:glycosyltransferase involved in cell wall biosynthesis